MSLEIPYSLVTGTIFGALGFLQYRFFIEQEISQQTKLSSKG